MTAMKPLPSRFLTLNPRLEAALAIATRRLRALPRRKGNPDRLADSDLDRHGSSDCRLQRCSSRATILSEAFRAPIDHPVRFLRSYRRLFSSVPYFTLGDYY